MNAPPEIRQLVERFQLHRDAYRSAHYNEMQVRREFVDPFFKALGWDVDNEQGYAEAYKDVIHEDALKFGGSTKAPDYCFRIGGVRKYFVETKRPSVNLKLDPEPAYQLRRYAWSAKLPLSVLTDFEEFCVYNCRVRPRKTHKASKERVLYITWEEYLDRWDEIAGIFSRDAILRGAFDKYAESKKKRGTAEVDEAFLKEIEGWREVLARNLALRNPGLSQRELNYAVQKTIDRIIFLRICEDRGIEPADRLRAVTNGPHLYGRLCQLFRAADDRYNSGLFHFQPEKGRPEDADEWTLALAVDDKPLKDIITGLYYPDSPYEFSVLPADILGQVYEQFLGKVIRLTKGHQARVEEKPEVRKAGGVYYTPTYIVDYIVANTVGKLLEGKTAYDVAARTKAWRPAKQGRPLTVLDPACGSGSFLIGAYQYLLDWYRDWYAANDPHHWLRLKEPTICETVAPAGVPPTPAIQNPKSKIQNGANFRLTTSEKKRILLDHIFGVDIDAQAVEVTKLSLLLKVLEGETRETLQRQLFARERALPDLGNNIKCGNSLIAPDFYDGRQLGMFDEEERYRINAFDWHREFPHIFGSSGAAEFPGFDVAIGNPPYIRIQTLNDVSPEQADYIKRHYLSASSGNFDIYVAFLERGQSLLSRSGRLGFIVPSKFLSTDYGMPLRGVLAESRSLEHLVDFGHSQVFPNATTYTCLVFLDRSAPQSCRYLRIAPDLLSVHANEGTRLVPLTSLGPEPWLFADETTELLVNKLGSHAVSLLEVPASMSRGTSTGADDVFCLREDAGALTTKDGEAVEVEPDILRKPIYATDFTRYCFRPENNHRIIFPYHVSAGGYELIAESDMKTRYPKTYAYLRSRKRRLESRKQWRQWYGFSAPRNLHVHDTAHFIVPLLADRGLAAPMPDPASQFCLMASGGFSISLHGSDLHPHYVLALVNSRPLYWNLQLISNKFRGGWITCTKQYFGTLPIRLLDTGDPTDKQQHDRVVELVEHLLNLHRQLPKARTGHEQTALRRQIETTDAEIDRLVYNLYGLSEGEVRIIEEAL